MNSLTNRNFDEKSLEVWSNINIKQQHLKPTPNRDGLVVEKGGVQQIYGHSGPGYPEENSIETKIYAASDLVNTFREIVNQATPKLTTRHKLQTLIETKRIIDTQINSSRVGYSMTDCALDCIRPPSVQILNKNIDNFRKGVEKEMSASTELSREILDIRTSLKSLGATEDQVEQAVLAFYQRAKNLISSDEANDFIMSLQSKDNSPLNEYLKNLVDQCEKHVTHKDWGRLRPPTKLQTSKLVADFGILYERLETLFPSASVYHRWNMNRMHRKETSSEMPIPTASSLDEIQKLCDRLMKVSSQIMDAVHDDLITWSKDVKNDSALKWAQANKIDPDQAVIARMLIEQGGSGPNNGAPYLYRAFFYLPMAYRLIATVNTEFIVGTFDNPKVLANSNRKLLPADWSNRFYTNGTDQYQWRQTYNEKCKKIVDAVGHTNLEKADQRFTNWAAQHKNGENIGRSGGTLPT